MVLIYVYGSIGSSYGVLWILMAVLDITHNLKRIQNSLNIPQHKLKLDVVTRWNSTLYMFESVLEQKMALAAYCAETGSIQQLTPHQLELMRKCIDVLSPIEEITRSISSDLALISIVIPYIRILTRTHEKNENDSGIRTMKGELLKSLKPCFAGIEERKELSLATILDPRFKDKFFFREYYQGQSKRCWLTK